MNAAFENMLYLCRSAPCVCLVCYRWPNIAKDLNLKRQLIIKSGMCGKVTGWKGLLAKDPGNHIPPKHMDHKSLRVMDDSQRGSDVCTNHVARTEVSPRVQIQKNVRGVTSITCLDRPLSQKTAPARLPYPS